MRSFYQEIKHLLWYKDMRKALYLVLFLYAFVIISLRGDLMDYNKLKKDCIFKKQNSGISAKKRRWETYYTCRFDIAFPLCKKCNCKLYNNKDIDSIIEEEKKIQNYRSETSIPTATHIFTTCKME